MNLKGIGDLEKAKPFLDLASNIFWVWVALIIFAILFAFFASKRSRIMVVLFQVILLPIVEFVILIYWSVNIT